LKKQSSLVLALCLVSFGVSPAYASPPVPSVVTITSSSGNGTAAGSTDATASMSWESKTTAGVLLYSVRVSATGRTDGTASTTCAPAPGNCSSVVTGLVGGVAYSFVVTAIAPDGAQASASAVTFTAQSVSEAPTPLPPTTTRGSTTLSWSSPTNTGGLALSGYIIEEESGEIDQIIITDPTTSTRTIDGLTAGVVYEFTIKARNALGNSAVAQFASVSSTNVPGVPSSVDARASGSTVSVTWVAPSANGSPITGYKIYLVNDSTKADVGQFTAATSSPGSITNVASGSYTVQVVATNAVGDGPRSVSTSAFDIDAGTQSNTPVLTPNISNLDIGGSVALAASAPSGGTVTIDVQASPAGACTFSAGTLTGVSAGTCTLSLTTPSTATYAAGSLERVVNIKTGQVITFAPISNQNLPGPFTLSATASSNLPVRFSASGSCLASGSQLTFIAAGGCSVTASQAGNSIFGPAPSIVRSFVISGGGAGGGGFFFPFPDEQKPQPIASAVFSKVKGSTAKSVSFAGLNARTTIKLGEAVRARLTGLPRGARVSAIVRTTSGGSYFLSASVVKSNKRYTTPAIKPKKKGTYQIAVTVGLQVKTLRIKVN
jgi:hypothetical protein